MVPEYQSIKIIRCAFVGLVLFYFIGCFVICFMARRPGGWDEKHMITISIGTSCADGQGNLLRGEVSLYLPPFNPRIKSTGLLFSSGRRARDKGVLALLSHEASFI